MGSQGYTRVNKASKGLQRITRVYKGLQGIRMVYKRIQGNTGEYKGIQENTGECIRNTSKYRETENSYCDTPSFFSLHARTIDL